MSEPNSKQNIMFLFFKTGAGHLSAAKALSSAMEAEYPDKINSVLVDGLRPDVAWQRPFLEGGYDYLVNKTPPLWALVYNITRFPPVARAELEFTYYNLRGYLRQIILDKKITKIVVLHFLLVYTIRRVLEEMGLEIPVITVVLDPFTAHPIWFYDKKHPLIVFSKRVKNFAINRHGFDPDKITVYPLLLKQQYEFLLEEKEKQRVRKNRGFRSDSKITLFAGGGEGIRGGEHFLEEALKQNLTGEIAFVCGKNEVLQAKCEALVEKYHAKDKVKVYGFIDFMYELMNICDVVVSKGGPATVMEALMLKKPLLVVFYVYGQEQGNVDYIQNRRLGLYEPDPKKAITRLRGWLEDPSHYQGMQDRIQAQNIRNGTEEIIAHLWNL